jgi:hypothetical protein
MVGFESKLNENGMEENFFEHTGRLCRIILNSGREYTFIQKSIEDDLIRTVPIGDRVIYDTKGTIRTTQVAGIYSEPLIVIAKK